VTGAGYDPAHAGNTGNRIPGTVGLHVGRDRHRTRASCPRCGQPVREPTVWSSAWRCELHGEVQPLLPPFSPSREGLDGLLRFSGVPVLAPWPLPAGWLLAGFAGVGDERTGAHATAVALAGPNPLGGPADMVVVAEEPGVGLGAALAGLEGVDPGAGFASTPPIASVSFGKHDFPLWQVDSPDRATFAGEIKALWLWLVLWPETAGILLIEPLNLRDLRDPGQELDLPFGALSPRLPAT
jgi:hypothetical protein